MFKQGPPSDGKSCVGLLQGNNIKFQKYCSTITRAGQIFRGTAVPIPSLGLGPPPLVIEHQVILSLRSQVLCSYICQTLLELRLLWFGSFLQINNVTITILEYGRLLKTR